MAGLWVAWLSLWALWRGWVSGWRGWVSGWRGWSLGGVAGLWASAETGLSKEFYPLDNILQIYVGTDQAVVMFKMRDHQFLWSVMNHNN